MKKAQFMGTYFMILIIGILIGAGIIAYATYAGYISSFICP